MDNIFFYFFPIQSVTPIITAIYIRYDAPLSPQTCLLSAVIACIFYLLTKPRYIYYFHNKSNSNITAITLLLLFIYFIYPLTSSIQTDSINEKLKQLQHFINYISQTINTASSIFTPLKTDTANDNSISIIIDTINKMVTAIKISPLNNIHASEITNFINNITKEIDRDNLENISLSITTGIIASVFLFVLTYMQTEKEEEHNLQLLLEKIARCNFLAKRMKELLYDIKKQEELNDNITLFKLEVSTAYQIASACKVSFIPVIAVADSFIQKLETTESHNTTKNFFTELNALHNFLYPNSQSNIFIKPFYKLFHLNKSQTTENISSMPEYKDIDKIKKIYKKLYDKIGSSSLSIPPTNSIPQAHKKQPSKDRAAPFAQNPTEQKQAVICPHASPRSRSRRTTHELLKKKSNCRRSPGRRMRKPRQ